MKVWWCEEHECNGDERYCYNADRFKSACRMVEMQLVPAEEPPKDPWDYDP